MVDTGDLKSPREVFPYRFESVSATNRFLSKKETGELKGKELKSTLSIKMDNCEKRKKK
jgi:hypothetical protein